MIELRMPSLGADMEHAVLVQWNVRPGQAVRRGDVACVVETQKGEIDVEAWQAGTLARRVAEPGQRIPVGGLLAVLAGEGEDWQAVASAPVPSAAPAAPAPPSMPLPAAAPAPTPLSDAAGPRPSAPPSAAPPPPAGAPGPAAVAPRVSPAARKRARELGLDLEALALAQGPAPVTLADVERAAAGVDVSAGPGAEAAGIAAAPTVGAAAPAGYAAGATTAGTSVAAAGAMRAAIAAAMARSKREIPHYYVGTEANVEPALRWLEATNAQRPLPERVLFAALALRAIALALREAPQLNGRYADGRFEPSQAIHLGVVTSLREGGIVIPTVHDADRLSLHELMNALRDVLTRARGGRLRSSDLADSTITVTNLGDLGCDTVYGVIYPPQVAIVGLGRVAPRPVVEDGRIAVARTVQLTLSADHRASDGLAGARFLATLSARLADPAGLAGADPA